MRHFPSILRIVLIAVITCVLVAGCALEGGGQYVPVTFPNSPEFNNPVSGLFNGALWPVGLFYEATDNPRFAAFDIAKRGMPYWLGYIVGAIAGVFLAARILRTIWRWFRR